MARMVIDENSQPIQVLTPDTLVNALVSGSSTATAIAALANGLAAQVVEIGASTDCWILFGTGATTVATTTGTFMPKGAVVVGVPKGSTHLAHIQHTTGGRISITNQV